MTLEQNKATWAAHNWLRDGEEWAAWWSDSVTQWKFTILPRIRQFLSVDTILEIGPGCGRQTQFLIEHCRRLIGVDITPECVARCRERFPGHEFILGDGISLDGIHDHSIDFAFSFDSLPHADQYVMGHYLSQLARKLKIGGVAWLHHSNAGTVADSHGWRDEKMTAEKFRVECVRAGLFVACQELVDWESDKLTDCFSTVQTISVSETTVRVNDGFRLEMAKARAAA